MQSFCRDLSTTCIWCLTQELRMTGHAGRLYSARVHIGLVFYPGFRQTIGSVDWVQKKKEVKFGKRRTIRQTMHPL